MKKLMAANWKMYKSAEEAYDTASELVDLTGSTLAMDREVLLLPPFTAIRRASQALTGNPGFLLGGQNFYPEEEGAFTGEISPRMLLDLGCTFALAGHSERRHVLGEDDVFVGRKVAYGLEKGLSMILCVGELIDQRKAGKVEDVLRTQLDKGLEGVDRGINPERIVIAYEPVWAIGTGEVAGPQEIVHAHGFVRSVLHDIFGDTGAQIRIQYGGSVKPDNASEIIHLDNVDGVLVGGASLRADSFSRIVLAK